MNLLYQFWILRMSTFCCYQWFLSKLIIILVVYTNMCPLFFYSDLILLYLSGILQAYSNAPVIYKIPIKINHPNAASSIDFSQPLTIPWCVAGAIPLSPNVIKTPRKCVQQSIGFKNIGTLRLECGVRSVQCAYMTSNHASHRLRCTNSINYNLPALKSSALPLELMRLGWELRVSW